MHISDNLFDTGTSGTITTNSNSNESDGAKFVSPDNDDFNIRYSSAARNNGNTSGVPLVDINGELRDDIDIGCYEWDCSTQDAGLTVSSRTICSNQPTTLTATAFEAKDYKWLMSSG